jgi:hypothetical protein
MRGRFLLTFFIFLLFYPPPGFSQRDTIAVSSDKVIADSIIISSHTQVDTIKHPDIILSSDQAIRFLQTSNQVQAWKGSQEILYSAVRKLIFEAANPPSDSTRYFLEKFLSDSVETSRNVFYLFEPAQNKIPEDTLFRTDTGIVESERDTISFSRYPSPLDSIKAAVGVLLDYLGERDTSIISFTGTGGKKYSLWLNSKSDKTIRFWLTNDFNDSVTVWIGNPTRNTIGLYLEHGVSFRRPSKQGNVSDPRINLEPPNNSNLVNIKKILTKSQFWKYHTEASFALNQGLVTNWVKGGENNISTALDITWYADYSNKPMLISSNHFARIKYGLIKSGDDRIRKNIDLLETNSKINHKAFGKFDFSGIMLFKTQVSRGYNYPNDSVPVSKFVNPAILTLGFGLDYKPDKFTSINFSPLSYKVTFVPDTASIDQTRYGVPANRKSKHEPGASFLISNEFRPVRNMTVTNRLQLFTNYITNPLNIDVDWELILQANLNWFTDVRLNTHLIFDDDTRTPVFDKDKNPVMGNDGLQKKTARIQFKELLGLSFIFRF